MVGADDNSLKWLFHFEIFFYPTEANGITRLGWFCPACQKMLGADRHSNIRNAGASFPWEKRQSRKDLRRRRSTYTWNTSLRILFGLKPEERLHRGSRALQEAALPEAFPKEKQAEGRMDRDQCPSRCRNTNTMYSLCLLDKEFPNTQRSGLKILFLKERSKTKIFFAFQ